MKAKRHKKDSALAEIEKTCKQYGAEVSCNEFCLNIKFKDDKTLIYVIGINGIKEMLNDILKVGIHGRVFKDNKFLGYAPKCKSLDEILVNVDMMM